MPRTAITSSNGITVGPYSHAIDPGELVFPSGQTPVDPATGELVDGDISLQICRSLDNLIAVLTAAGLGPDNVINAMSTSPIWTISWA